MKIKKYGKSTKKEKIILLLMQFVENIKTLTNNM